MRVRMRNGADAGAVTTIFLAEEVGFEPTDACTSHAFEACPLGHSGTLPISEVIGVRRRTVPAKSLTRRLKLHG